MAAIKVPLANAAIVLIAKSLRVASEEA